MPKNTHWVLFWLTKGQKISKQNCRAVTSSKNERTNLFFYPDSPKILETWTSKFKFQVFTDCQNRKTISFIRFWKKLRLDNFCFEIYWPLIGGWFYFDSLRLLFWFDLFFEARAKILEKISLVFCTKFWHFEINWPLTSRNPPKYFYRCYFFQIWATFCSMYQNLYWKNITLATSQSLSLFVSTLQIFLI